MSGIINDAAFNDVFTATKGDSVMQALVTAVYELGCLAGAIYALIFGDWMGRRWMIFSGAIVMIIGVIIQSPHLCIIFPSCSSSLVVSLQALATA